MQRQIADTPVAARTRHAGAKPENYGHKFNRGKVRTQDEDSPDETNGHGGKKRPVHGLTCAARCDHDEKREEKRTRIRKRLRGSERQNPQYVDTQGNTERSHQAPGNVVTHKVRSEADVSCGHLRADKKNAEHRAVKNDLHYAVIGRGELRKKRHQRKQKG